MAALLKIMSFEEYRRNLQLIQCFNGVSVEVGNGKIGQRIWKKW